MFAAYCWVDGGDSGTELVQCDLEYTVRTLGATSATDNTDNFWLGSGLTPAKRRPLLGTLVSTSGYCTCFYDEDGDLVLFDVGETLDVASCT